METWATFSIIDHLKPIGDQTQEELDQLEAVDYLREAQVVSLPFVESLTCVMPRALSTPGRWTSSWTAS
jgi:hypothetical protein